MVIETARERVTREAPDVQERLSFVAADLTTWKAPHLFNLVVSQYVHPDESFTSFVGRLAQLVTPGGTLFVVGHAHDDEHSHDRAPAEASVTIESMTNALDKTAWQIDVAEPRVRQIERGEHVTELKDLVMKARRLKAERCLRRTQS